MDLILNECYSNQNQVLKRSGLASLSDKGALLKSNR